MSDWLKPLLILALCAVAGQAHAQSLTIKTGQAKIFGLATAGGVLSPAHVRSVAMGQAMPGAGDLMITLAPAGHAVGVAKLHVFERTAKPVNFQVTAFQGGKPIATENVCGRLDMDAWVSLPAETSRVVISKLIAVERECHVLK